MQDFIIAFFVAATRVALTTANFRPSQDMDPEDADYVCTLTDASLEKARRELHEDPKQRLGAVQTLRNWIKEQKHFKCRQGEAWVCFTQIIQ